MPNNLDQIIDLAEQVSSPLGLDVLDANFSQTGKQRCLRITIYRKGGSVGLSDCEQVSRNLEGLLDNITPPIISGNYLLEVQSPGLDRALKSEKDFQVFSGQLVEIITCENIAPLGNHFIGYLSDSSSHQLKIDKPKLIKEKSNKQKKVSAKNQIELPTEINLALKNISQIKLYTEV